MATLNHNLSTSISFMLKCKEIVNRSFRYLQDYSIHYAILSIFSEFKCLFKTRDFVNC